MPHILRPWRQALPLLGVSVSPTDRREILRDLLVDADPLPWSPAQLARRFGVSTTTLYRDLRALRAQMGQVVPLSVPATPQPPELNDAPSTV